jgi:DNA-binding Lrp family transcriptional regulator
MTNRGTEGMDEIDRSILGLLSEDPRMPYSDIAQRLEERGYSMSSEGIRYRVQHLFDATSTFFMLDPEEHDWHVLRLSITVADEADARRKVEAKLSEMPFWFISAGFGSFDVYAVATSPSTRHLDGLLSEVRGLEFVEDIGYFVETHRDVDVRKYLQGDADDEEAA